MLSASLGVLLIGAGIGVHLQESGELDLQKSVALLDALAESIQTHTGVPPTVDNPDWAQCNVEAEACLLEIRARTKSTELILVRALAGMTKIRVVAERIGDIREPIRAKADLSLDSKEWVTQLAPVVAELFPLPISSELIQSKVPDFVLIDEPGQTSEPSVAPWVLLGTAGVAAGVGIGFGISSRDARGQIEGGNLTGDEFTALNDRMQTHGLVANVLFGVAAGAAVAGIVWLIADN